MTHILITGASGYIGGKLVQYLAQETSHALHVVVRPNADTRTLSAIPKVHLHVYDGSHASLEEIFQQCAIVQLVHVAGFAAHPHSPDDIDTMLNANIHFGSQLLEAFTAAGGRKVVATGSYSQHAETEEYCPNSFYAATKQAFEQILLYYTRHKNVTAINLKLGDVYGENDPRGKIFRLLQHAQKSGETLAMTDGNQMLCPVHIDDVCRAYAIALTQLNGVATSGLTNYFVAGKLCRLRDLVEEYCRNAEVKPTIAWGRLPYRPGQVMQPYIGPSLPGWEPTILLEQGLRRIQHG